MARTRRQSKVLNESNQRIIGITEVDPQFDLGNGVSLASLKEKNGEVLATINQYNQLVVQLDGITTLLKRLEGELRGLNSRTLAGVRSRYGADSSEYEKAGGVRTSEKKKPVRRAPQG